MRGTNRLIRNHWENPQSLSKPRLHNFDITVLLRVAVLNLITVQAVLSCHERLGLIKTSMFQEIICPCRSTQDVLVGLKKNLWGSRKPAVSGGEKIPRDTDWIEKKKDPQLSLIFINVTGKRDFLLWWDQSIIALVSRSCFEWLWPCGAFLKE